MRCAGWQCIALQRGRPLAIAEGRTWAAQTCAAARAARRHLWGVNATFTAITCVSRTLSAAQDRPRSMLVRSTTIEDASPNHACRPDEETPPSALV